MTPELKFLFSVLSGPAMATPALSSSVTEFPFFSNGSANASTSHESGDYDDDDGDDGENWLSPRRLLSLLTTVLVPLVFGVIVVVGESHPSVCSDIFCL